MRAPQRSKGGDTPFTSMVCPMQQSDAMLPPADITMVSLMGHLGTLKPQNQHKKKSLYWQ